ncbi:hypothetical protein BAJUN_01540 [Bajunvirus bajun]|uniref:Uncharacterized protein n=1 Tax=Brevundimonas phage vB_BgoS-Bajun TaxID=2948594 RepID=A0A9E7N4U3_9CAUD|nr:hypothetical protein BAJUN_01540 [Brevundimonas phage vB_BgoS-Bajun]
MTTIETVLRTLAPRPSAHAITTAVGRCRAEGASFEEVKTAFRRQLTHKKRSTVDDMVNQGWRDAEPEAAAA